ncbi:hypothetical protein RIF29_28911 [Crotalaria pallida]|uniref:Uncharacterized protein n=1 Tax=Crotalaria pallida TaxID=3830 RepID=A0AAN9EFQ6_CROPI
MARDLPLGLGVNRDSLDPSTAAMATKLSRRSQSPRSKRCRHARVLPHPVANRDSLWANHEPPRIASTPSWFQFLNNELVRVASFSDHEAFDHPVACLLAVSSKDEQPINRFVDLFNTNKLPSLLNDGAMDPKILKHYLLVHDNQDGPADRYNFNSIESQIRVLGDYAFMLRDYELALSNYRLISTDYKIDKAWKSYAGVQVISCFQFQLEGPSDDTWLLHGL